MLYDSQRITKIVLTRIRSVHTSTVGLLQMISSRERRLKVPLLTVSGKEYHILLEQAHKVAQLKFHQTISSFLIHTVPPRLEFVKSHKDLIIIISKLPSIFHLSMCENQTL